MNDEHGRIGLEFFGKVTASISHDINNRLAVINEQAGLLEDHISLALQGRDLEFDRLKKISSTVQRQVGEANAIIKNMNRFAHSSDEPVQLVDLNAALDLAVALSRRAASMRKVELKVQMLDEPREIKTSFFNLLNLIWICLNMGIAAAPSQGEIRAKLDIVSEKTVLLVRTDSGQEEKFNEDMISTAGRLAAGMGLSFELDRKAGHIDVHLE